MGADQAKGTKDRVSRDAIYSEMSNAALRHRNYETEIARWYTTVLVAMLGFIISSRFETPGSGIAQVISENLVIRATLAGIVSSVAFLSCYLFSAPYPSGLAWQGG
jgi:hypothetical protein